MGVDLTKNVKPLHDIDAAERMVIRAAVSREKFLDCFLNCQPCVIAMEARSRRTSALAGSLETGCDVRLIAPKFEAPCRTGGVRVKNDEFDTETICEADNRLHKRYMPVKATDQQRRLILSPGACRRTCFAGQPSARVARWMRCVSATTHP